MIQTGKYYEAIVEMLTNFRSEVQTFSSLGLLNINKHSENFMKRILNLTYGYGLENLNKEKQNFPGLDLGDTGKGIAFQITSTKTSAKIDDTLTTCLKYNHYGSFKNINVFILTTKQNSYSINVVTEPHFKFSPDNNIYDFNDLLKDIEHLDPALMKALYDYIKDELDPTIELIRNDAPENKKQLLDAYAGMAKSSMTTFCVWRSNVSVKNLDISVPELHTKLNNLLSSAALRNQLLPILNPALRKTISGKQILYQQDVVGIGVGNLFYGNAILIEKSSITIERVIYSNNEILANLFQEMRMLLTKILFFSKYAKNKFEIEVSVSLESNTKVYFHPVNSLVIDRVLSTFTLENPFELKEILTDIDTSALANLLQNIMHAFISHSPNFGSQDPFLVINTAYTEFEINNIKTALGL